MALSRYRILGRLGSGGMGTVYLAEDVTLKRTVALKFLNPSSVSPEQGRARFVREAHMAAGLNHPTLCTIHEVGEVGPGEEQALGAGERLEAGTPFIAMEMIEGPTLEAMLRQRGAFAFDELLRIALQVAEGMAAAHARGIVHRDLKPGNVMVTKEGRVKILDFGLAKPLEPAAPGDDSATAAATASAELTREGRVIGTAAYMSPEQAKGEAVDTRSDVFSFGVMLYEMATGNRPFRGTTTLSTLAKIIEADPEPIPESRADIPLELRRIIRRCLQKRPEDRYNDTRDLMAALRALRHESTSGVTKVVSAAPATAPVRSWLLHRGSWAAAAAVVVLAAVAAGVWLWPHAARLKASALPTFRQITFTGTVSDAAISPDGQFVAAVEGGDAGPRRLVVVDPAGGEPLTIFTAKFIASLRWSPDGTELYIFASDGRGGYAGYLVPRLGGTPRPVSPFTFVAWSPDGKRIAGAASASREIYIKDRLTGEQRTIPIDVPFTWLASLDWSPNGDLFAFGTLDKTDGPTLWTIPAEGGAPNRVGEAATRGSLRFSPLGDALYYLSGKPGSATTSLLKVRIDPKSGRRAGEPAVVLSGLEIGGLSPSFTTARGGGRLVYARRATQANLWLAEPDGKAAGGVRTTPLTSGTSVDTAPRFSPDGRSVVFIRRDNLFVLPLDGGSPQQLTFGDAVRSSPAWSPDGRDIAFGSSDGGTPRVWRIRADGGVPRAFKKTVMSDNLAWSPGKKIVYQKAGNRNFILLDPITEEETPLLKDESAGWLFGPRYSPDGTRLAISWNRIGSSGESGPRAWVVSLDDSSQRLVGDGKSVEFPLGWSPDGTWVYVVISEAFTPDGNLVSPAISKVPSGRGAGASLVKLPFKEVDSGDVSPDGSRFVFSVVDSRADAWLVEDFDPREE